MNREVYAPIQPENLIMIHKGIQAGGDREPPVTAGCLLRDISDYC